MSETPAESSLDVFDTPECQAVAEVLGMVAEGLDAEIDQASHLVDPVVVARARLFLMHIREATAIMAGGQGSLLSKAFQQFCCDWQPRIVEHCGGLQRGICYTVAAAEMAMRLGLSFDDLMQEASSAGDDAQ